MNDSEIARSWRQQHGYIGRGGVVVIYAGEVQSWVNTLRDPDHWQAGCVAVDEHGQRWEAVGGLPGTALDAATEWRELEGDSPTAPRADPFPPKPPRRDCRQAGKWCRYYAAMADWHTRSAAIIARTMPGSSAVQFSLDEAARFSAGAKDIADGTHPNIVSGLWT